MQRRTLEPDSLEKAAEWPTLTRERRERRKGGETGGQRVRERELRVSSKFQMLGPIVKGSL